MQRKIRIIVDVIMLVCFLILMGYHITSNQIHEVLGVVTFLLFIIHHIINRKYYQTLWKGKYTGYRIAQLLLNILLSLAMLGMIISGILISANVFSFLNLQTTMFGRNLHMVSTSWGFVLMALHLGLHLNALMVPLTRKMKNSTLEYVYYFLIFLLMLAGIYFFFDTELWKDMFLVTQFKFFDYDQNPLIFYIGEFTIVCFFSLCIYFVFRIQQKRKLLKVSKK